MNEQFAAIKRQIQLLTASGIAQALQSLPSPIVVTPQRSTPPLIPSLVMATPQGVTTPSIPVTVVETSQGVTT